MASQTAVVHKSIAQPLLDLILAHRPNVVASANSESDGASLRGLFSETSSKRVQEIVDDAVAKGAHIAVGTNSGSISQALDVNRHDEGFALAGQLEGNGPLFLNTQTS